MNKIERLKSLVRRALASPRFDSFVVNDENAPIAHLRFDLPPEQYRGVPNEWIAVLVEVSRFHQNDSLTDLFDRVRQLLASLQRGGSAKSIPLLLLPDGPEHLISDEFSQDPGVFCLNARDLPILDGEHPKPAQHPLTVAIRRKLPSANAIPQALWPYHGMQPSIGWRFYGRHEQLTKLVDSTDSFLLVGPRRIGKTSLLRETLRRLNARNQEAYFIDVQDASSITNVIEKIFSALDFRQASHMRRRAQEFGEKPLEVLLKQFSSTGRSVTLLIDELGNVLTSLPEASWRFLGTLRRFMHEGNLRVVASCFQEFYLAQQAGMNSPHTNFAQELRLSAFTADDVRDFALGPWEYWNPMDQRHRDKILSVVLEEIGRHPLFLQAFGYGMFKEFQASSAQSNGDLYNAAATVARKKMLDYFDEAVEQVFYNIGSGLLRYLYLKLCHDAKQRGDRPAHLTMIDDAWMRVSLQELGFASTVLGRRNIFVALELHGLIEPVDHNRSRQIITSPIVYSYIERVERESGIAALLSQLAQDCHSEHLSWDLTPESQSAKE